MWFIYGLIVAGTPLLVIEVLSRRRAVQPELSRKLTHVLSSLATIALTAFCSLHQIAVLAALFVIMFTALRHRHIWQSLYSVERHSWGEICFPLGVLAASLATQDIRSFIIIILLVGLADTAASMVGQAVASPKLSLVHSKSVAGSLAFFISALIITSVGAGHLSLASTGLAIIATVAESVSPYGTDNATIVLAALAYLSMIPVSSAV